MQALNEEFQTYRTKLELLEEIMHYVSETEKDDPTLVAEVRDKFCAVEDPFERLHSAVLQRQARLQNIVIQNQDFQLSLSEAQDQLNEFERNIAELQPISAIYEVALQQKEDHEVTYSVANREIVPKLTVRKVSPENIIFVQSWFPFYSYSILTDRILSAETN